MSAFIPKPLFREENFGEKLRQIRLLKNKRIEDLARSLGIRRDYLLALEEGRLEDLPSGLYGKSFLKKYAQSLGMPAKEIARYFDEFPDDNRENDPFSQKVVKKKEFIIFPRLLRNILIGVAILACLAYLVFYFHRAIRPPKLEIFYPQTNLLSSDISLTVSGQTEPETEVKINGALVLIDKEGNFNQKINLKKGLNTLTISAKKKYSRENLELRQILVE